MQNLFFWIAALVALFFLGEFGSFMKEVGVLLGIVVVITPVAVYYAILQSLPEEVEVSPAPGRMPMELRELVTAFQSLGFEQAYDPLRIELAQEAILVPLVNPQENMIATVFRLDAATPKVAYDVVSFFDAPNTALTTGMDHGGGVLPAPDGQLRQIFQNASVDELVHRHRQALRFLDQHRVPTVAVASSAIPGLLRLSIQLNRKAFLKARVTNTFVALWRTITKRNPYQRPLNQQPNIEKQLAKFPRPRVARRAPPRRQPV